MSYHNLSKSYFNLLLYFLFFCSFLDAPFAEQPAIVIQKLQQCQKIFDFYDPVAQLKSKEVCSLYLTIFFDISNFFLTFSGQLM